MDKNVAASPLFKVPAIPPLKSKTSEKSITPSSSVSTGKFVRRCLKWEMEKAEKEQQQKQVTRNKVSESCIESSLTDATKSLVDNVEAIVTKNEKLMEYNKERMRILMKEFKSAEKEIENMKSHTFAKINSPHSYSEVQRKNIKKSSTNESDISIFETSFEDKLTIDSLRLTNSRIKNDYERLNKLYLETFKEKQELIVSNDNYKEREVERLEKMGRLLEEFKLFQTKIKMFHHERLLVKHRLESMGFNYTSIFNNPPSTNNGQLSTSLHLSPPLSSFSPPISTLNVTPPLEQHIVSLNSSTSMPCGVALDMMQYYVDSLQQQFVTSQPIDLVYSLICEVDKLNETIRNTQGQNN